MIRTRKVLVFFLANVLISNAAAVRVAAQETVDIRPKFTPGARHYLELTQNIEDKWEGSSYGPAKTEKRKWTRGVNRSIEPPFEEGGYVVPLAFDRVVYDGDSRVGLIQYDSDLDDRSQPINPVTAIARYMLDGSFMLLITNHGRGAGLTGIKTLYKRIEDTEAANPLLETLMAYFSEDAERFTWGHFPYALYPFAPVKVGDTWSVPLRAFDIFLGETEYDLKCRLDGITTKNGRKIAKVGFTATLSTPPDARKGMYMRILRLELQSGKLEGTAEYDVEQNEFVNQQSKTVMNITATIYSEDDEPDTVFGLQRTIDETRTVMSEEQRIKQKKARKKAGK